MDEFNITLGLIGALAFVLAAFLYAALASAWRMLQDGGKLRIARMACAEKEECDRWLASGSRGSIAGFCPNAAFIEHAKKARRS